jgi:hypothetical protein
MCVTSGQRISVSEDLGAGFWSPRGCRNKLTIDQQEKKHAGYYHAYVQEIYIKYET